MLRLTFAESGPGPTLERGPFPEIAFDGNDLRAIAEGNPLIARHREHYWFVGEQKFFRVDFNTAVEVQFQAGGKASEILGPFIHFSSADGIAYADGRDIGHIDPHSGQWFSHIHQAYWARLVIRPV